MRIAGIVVRLAHGKYNCNYMSQITIYLDPDTQRLARKSARAAKESTSKWIAETIRRRVRSEWPPDVVKLLGSWKADDFPEPADLRKGYAKDSRRALL